MSEKNNPQIIKFTSLYTSVPLTEHCFAVCEVEEETRWVLSGLPTDEVTKTGIFLSLMH